MPGSTPLRNTRSHVQLQALPVQVGSKTELLSALTEIKAVASTSGVPEPNLPSNLVFRGASLTGSLESALPVLISTAHATSSKSRALSKIAESSTACLAYLVSGQYEKELTDSILRSDAFKAAVSEQVASEIEERRANGELTGLDEPVEKAVRDPALENRVHWVIHEMIYKQFKKGGFTVSGGGSLGKKEWPVFDPSLTDMKTLVDVSSSVVKTVWRPNWDDVSQSSSFVEAAVAKFKIDESAYSDDQIRARIWAYMGWIALELKKMGTREKAEESSKRTVTARTSTLRDSMRGGFDRSLLARCRERNTFIKMRDLNLFSVTQYSRLDAHPFPTQVARQDGTVQALDGFLLYRDLAFETKGVEGDAWAVAEPTWWSDLIRLGFWTLYAQSHPTNANTRRTPLFPVPVDYLDPIDIHNAPPLAPQGASSTAPTGSKRKRKTGKSGLELTRDMISTLLLDDEEMQTWVEDLRDPPVLTAAESAVPTLAELLRRPEHRDLKEMVDKHLVRSSAVDTAVLASLWDLRRQAPGAMYVEALRSDDLGEYLDQVDWLGLMVNDED